MVSSEPAHGPQIDSDSEDDDSDWGEDEWPLERPLPLPEWGCERPDLKFSSLKHYHGFIAKATRALHLALDTHSYDSLSNFLMFSSEYQSSRDEYENLMEFYRDYDPPLVPGRYTCVGLASDLATRLSPLESQYPGLKDATYQVSCEEEVKDVDWYCSGSVPPANNNLKEHVLLCVRISVCGRAGVVLFDPGYHVGLPVTVMEDGLAPQSGPIRGSTTRADVARIFHYRYHHNNPAFVLWEVEERKEGKPPNNISNLIHVTRPYLSAVDVAERRNLVYTFKTLLGRDCTGQLTCGLYFPVRECSRVNLTFFLHVDGLPTHRKVPLAYFRGDSVPEKDVESAVAAVAEGTGRSKEDLRKSLVNLANLLQDKDFVQQVVDLDKCILDMQASQGSN